MDKGHGGRTCEQISTPFCTCNFYIVNSCSPKIELFVEMRPRAAMENAVDHPGHATVDVTSL